MKVAPLNEDSDASTGGHNPQKLPEQVVMMSCEADQCEMPVPNESVHSAGATEANGSTAIEQIQGIKLRGPFPSQNEVNSTLLWAQRPVIIMIVRRLGCPLCRHSFRKMKQMKFEFDKIGVDLVAISNQDLYAQDFIDEVWSGLPLYIDESDRFREAMGAPVYKGIWFCKPAVLKKACCVSLPKSGGRKDVNKKADRVGGDLVVANHGIFFERNEDTTFSHTEPAVLLKAARKARGFPE